MIVVLTSAGRPGDAARCRQLGIAAYLQKPIKRADLRAAMLIALGARARGGPPSLVTRHTLRGTHPSGCVLVVGDDVINRLLAKRLLEKRGHSVVAADDGSAALALLAGGTSGEFGCLLLDLQVSALDGLECVRLIRERERTSGRHLAIIAMTADPIEGNDIRWLEAGVDGCPSKPIQPQALYGMIDRHLGRTTTSRPPSTIGPNTKSMGSINVYRVRASPRQM